MEKPEKFSISIQILDASGRSIAVKVLECSGRYETFALADLAVKVVCDSLETRKR